MPRATYATLKMLGYSARGQGMPKRVDWSRDETRTGIRIARGKTPSPDLFHEGQPVVIYDSQERTVPSYGHFVGEVYTVDPPRYGCDLEIRYVADGGITDVASAPKFHEIVDLSTRQGSYRGLSRDEFDRLVSAIQAHPGHRSFD